MLAIMDVICIYTTILTYMAKHRIYCVLSLTLKTKNIMCPLFKHFPSKFYGGSVFPPGLPYLHNTVTACPPARIILVDTLLLTRLHTQVSAYTWSNPQVNLMLKPKSWTYYAKNNAAAPCTSESHNGNFNWNSNLLLDHNWKCICCIIFIMKTL